MKKHKETSKKDSLRRSVKECKPYEDPLWIERIASISGTKRGQLRKNIIIMVFDYLGLDKKQLYKKKGKTLVDSKTSYKIKRNMDKLIEMLYLKMTLDTLRKNKEQTFNIDEHPLTIDVSSPLNISGD